MKDDLPKIYASTAILISPTTHETSNFMQRSPLEVSRSSADQGIPRIYETRKFATIHTTA